MNAWPFGYRAGSKSIDVIDVLTTRVPADRADQTVMIDIDIESAGHAR